MRARISRLWLGSIFLLGATVACSEQGLSPVADDADQWHRHHDAGSVDSGATDAVADQTVGSGDGGDASAPQPLAPERRADWTHAGAGPIPARPAQCGPTIAAYAGTADTINEA